jgi:kynurenine formamidase
MVELSHPLVTNMPGSPNHPAFRMTLIRRHGDAVRPDGGSASNELIVTGGHVGTHVDALAHVSQNGKLHGGIDAERAQRGGLHTEHGAERIPPMITRGVLLDVAAARGMEVLPGGYAIGPAELAAAAERADTQPQPGDVALVRTGWARHFGNAAAYRGHESGVPGVDEDGARWLAERHVIAVGSDTTAFEHIAPGEGHRTLPVHRILLVEHGIHIIEHLDLEHAATHGLTEFLFVMAPLRIVGGTGSPVRPLAVITA